MSYATKPRPNRPTLRTKKLVYKDAAMLFKNAKTKKEAQRISKSTGVKFSELLRLPYFDPVRMIVVDPMHAFLLGLVRNETEKHLNQEHFNYKYSLPPKKHKELSRRIKGMRVPYDIARTTS
jgi:hypothetical protein